MRSDHITRTSVVSPFDSVGRNGKEKFRYFIWKPMHSILFFLHPHGTCSVMHWTGLGRIKKSRIKNYYFLSTLTFHTFCFLSRLVQSKNTSVLLPLICLQPTWNVCGHMPFSGCSIANAHTKLVEIMKPQRTQKRKRIKKWESNFLFFVQFFHGYSYWLPCSCNENEQSAYDGEHLFFNEMKSHMLSALWYLAFSHVLPLHQHPRLWGSKLSLAV